MRGRVFTVALFAFSLHASALAGAAAGEPPEGLAAGDTALASGDFEAADAAYREVLETAPSSWQAREGLARSLAARDREAEAIETWRRALLDADLAELIPAADHGRLSDSREALAKLDDATRDLNRLLARAAKDLGRAAASGRKKSPQLADRALRLVLRMDPLRTEAREALAEFGMIPFDRWHPMFGDSFEDWGRVNSKEWKVLGKNAFELDGRKSVFGTGSDAIVDGDFDMRVEIRVDESLGEGSVVGVVGGRQGVGSGVEFGIGGETVFLRERRWEEHRPPILYREALDAFDPPLAADEFNVFELQFRGDTVTALVNGRRLTEFRRTFDRHRGGMGVFVQLAKVTFRNFEVRKR